MLSLLRLNSVRVQRLVIRGRSDDSVLAGRQEYLIVLSRKIGRTGDLSDRPWLEIRVRLTPDCEQAANQSFDEIDVIVKGHFSFAEEITEEMRAQLFPLTAVSMLFGVIRGIVAQATGMFPCGTFLLPPINVVDAAKRKRLACRCALVSAEGATRQATLHLRAAPSAEVKAKRRKG